VGKGLIIILFINDDQARQLISLKETVFAHRVLLNGGQKACSVNEIHDFA